MSDDVSTLSLVTPFGCDARCQFCVSEMNPGFDLEPKEPVDWRSFRKICMAAFQGRCKTVMITGKGEPTLYWKLVTQYLKALKTVFSGFFEFPYIELQTNGISIASNPEKFDPILREWYDLGLNTIAVSVVHHDAEKNHKNYIPYRDKYIDLPKLIEALRGYGFTVRISCVMIRDHIDTPERVQEMIDYAREHKVKQLTLIPVNKPADFSNDRDDSQKVWNWTSQNHVTPENFAAIKAYLEEKGHLIRTLSHGARIFDVDGQNVCLSNCLSVQPDTTQLRNLIFFPNGEHRFYWQYAAANLM